MSSSRIEQIIEEIEEYVESCRYQPLSTTKIVVNKEELEELLRELRMKTPDEIKRYQKIISNKDAILADAQSKADNIIAEAQAQGILDSAQQDANNIRMSAISYTDELLANLSQITGNAIAAASESYNAFAGALQSYYDVVNRNRSELSPQGGTSAAAVPASDEPEIPEVTYDDLDDEE